MPQSNPNKNYNTQTIHTGSGDEPIRGVCTLIHNPGDLSMGWRIMRVKSMSVYSPAKPKAGFGTRILIKAMTANTTTSTNAGEGLPPKSGERILIDGDADPWQLFYVSAAASAVKPKAAFGRTIIIKLMTAIATPNKNAVEGLYPKSGDWTLIKGGVDPCQLVHWILSPWPHH